MPKEDGIQLLFLKQEPKETLFKRSFKKKKKKEKGLSLIVQEVDS